MALTHAQRTSMFSTLAEVMGQDDAETLMQHLPPSGWDNVATKEDLRAGLAELTSAMTAGFAQAATDRAAIIKAMTEGLAQAAVERADIIKATADGFAQAATARADKASVRSILTPTGRGVTRQTRSTARVMAATVSGSTRPMRKGASPKFSTIMPLAPPSVRVAASRSACSSTTDRSPPHRGEPGRGGR